LLDLFSISAHFLKPQQLRNLFLFIFLLKKYFPIFVKNTYFSVTQILIVILIIMRCSRVSEESSVRSSARHRLRKKK